MDTKEVAEAVTHFALAKLHGLLDESAAGEVTVTEEEILSYQNEAGNTQLAFRMADNGKDVVLMRTRVSAAGRN